MVRDRGASETEIRETSRGPTRCAWLFFFMIVLLFEIFLNVLVLKLHYICINNIL